MTFLTSSPRAETPVATKMGVLAWRKPRLERKNVSHLPRIQSQKHLQCILPLPLSSVRVNGCAREPHVIQIVINEIGLGPVIDKDQSAGWWHRHEQVIEALLLFVLLGVDDL